MLQNPLLTETSGSPDTIGYTNQTKINNPVYLFSDIIHVVGAGQSKTGYNFSGDVPLSNSQLNFTDILGKYTQTPDYNNTSATNEQTTVLLNQNDLSEKININDVSGSGLSGENNQLSDSAQVQNTLSFTGLQEFLTGLFNRLSAAGFKLTQIKGLPLNSGNNQNNEILVDQNNATEAGTTASLSNNILSININISENNIDLSQVQENNSGSSKKDTKTAKQVTGNINAIILNLLNQDKPVTLNLNFPEQNLKIEISGSTESEQAAGNIEKNIGSKSLLNGSLVNGTEIGKTSKGQTEDGLQIEVFSGTNEPNIDSNDNSIQINLTSPENITSNESNLKIATVTSSENNPAVLADEVTSKVTGKNNKQSINSSELDLLNSKASSIKDSSANIDGSIDSIKINPISSKDEMILGQSENLTNNSSAVSSDESINKSTGKTSPQADNKYNVTISSNNKNFLNDLGSILQEFGTTNTVDKKLFNAQQKLFYHLNGIEIKNNSQGIENGSASAFLNNLSTLKANLSSALEEENNTNSKISNGKNIDNKNAENLSSDYSNTLNKIIINQNKSLGLNKTINAGKTVSTSDAKGNSTNNLAGALQSGDQTSTGSNNYQTENNNVSGVKVNNDVSPIANVKAETAGSELGKKSDRGNKQSGDSKINSGQLINSDKQSVIKNNNINTNVKQFNDVFKTVNAQELISELSNYMGQGKSKSVMLKLKPENLGKVKIVLKVVDKTVHANLEVENESVKQAIQNNISTLKQSLNMNGLQLSSITVSLSDGENKSGNAFTKQQKKKASRGLNNKKINIVNESVASKNMGYNTYEYLI